MLVIQRPTIEAVRDADGNRQQFSIGPLEPGFGHTLGNSLRRTLLSSIPGAAITQIKFDDALHEFSTIDGIVEDVTDIVLNLKDVELRSHSDDPVTLRVDVRGAADVTAAVLESNEQVEVLNPGLHLATVTSKGRLALELTVEVGRGYLGSDRTSGEGAIGVIPMDALFSPVRRVSIDVEPVSVGQAQDMDRLLLDITTDGSITPRDALASAGATLRALVQLVEDMSDDARGLELGEPEEVGGSSPDLDMPIEDLDLSERPRNCLKRAQVDTIGQLLEKTEDDLLAVTNFGQKSLDEVIEKLDERGRFGGSSAHQKSMMANLVSSLILAEGITTTEAKAKALRPIAEKMITKARKGGLHNHRQVVAFIRDREVAAKLFDEIGPRYIDRHGGYTRILKLGPRTGDNAPMARIELV